MENKTGHWKEVAWSHWNKLMEGLRLGLRTVEQGFRVKEKGLQLLLLWEMGN